MAEKVIPIITVCGLNQSTYADKLLQSAHKQGWTVHLLEREWKGFSTKIVETYHFLKEHPEITEFIFADAFDVVVLGTQDEFLSKIGEVDTLFSAEKGCWPNGTLANLYPDTDSHFKFLNSGLYYSKSDKFIEIIEYSMPELFWDDQLYFTGAFLSNKFNIQLDTHQKIFNSHSFIAENEYNYDNNRVQILGNQPVMIHFNGKTIDIEFDKNITI